MNIKLKLSLQFTLLVSIILIFFAALVYYFYYESQLSKFRENITDTARNTAILLIDVVEVDSTLLKKIQRSTSSWEDEEVVITDTAFKLIYGNNAEYLTETVIRKNHSGNVNYFTILEKDGVFYNHKFKNRTYYVYAMAYDKSRADNLRELLKVLFWSILISVVLSIYLSYIFSRKAIWPISELIRRIKTINSSKLSDRLDEGNKKDEIAQLAITFNEMLTDLEIAFKNQEDFVSNASHELYTPLTLMLVESEYLLSRERTPAEYKKHISSLMEDIRQLNSMLNSLLELAHLNKDISVEISKIRIDEIVFSSIQNIKEKFEGRKIIPKIRYPEDDSDLLINGNPGLLMIAFNNLIENACKFSDADVIIEFQIATDSIAVVINDEGIGIPANQINDVINPFKRGNNARYKGGYGIGLALVSKILQIHNVPLRIASNENKGTAITLEFKRVQFPELSIH
jgi:signal transduction histidine kinase